jgi:Ca-activated chloride channel family protein
VTLRRTPRQLLIVATLCVLAGSGALAGQVFRQGIDLVVVTAAVVDKAGRPVLGLGRDDFSVFEDGVQQPIAQFTGERVPISLGILVDISDSMFGGRIVDARRAIDRFVLELLQPEDEAFLMTFNHEPDLVQGWTLPPRELAGRLDHAKPFGGTALYDALIKTAPLFGKRRHQRCGLVIISDGEDTASDARLQDALAALSRTDAFVYAIAIDAPTGPAINRRFSPDALREITGQNGGYTAVIHVSPDLGEATERIATELNHQYTLGFSAAHGADGRYHVLRVRTLDASMFARARRGYYAIPRAGR